MSSSHGIPIQNSQELVRALIEGLCPQIAKETLPEQVVIAECPDTASVLQAVTTGLACLEDDLQGCVFVMPLNMPLLEMTDTLASMERMLLLRVAHAQVSNKLSNK